jgi:hypothetical protein
MLNKILKYNLYYFSTITNFDSFSNIELKMTHFSSSKCPPPSEIPNPFKTIPYSHRRYWWTLICCLLKDYTVEDYQSINHSRNWYLEHYPPTHISLRLKLLGWSNKHICHGRIVGLPNLNLISHQLWDPHHR